MKIKFLASKRLLKSSCDKLLHAFLVEISKANYNPKKIEQIIYKWNDVLQKPFTSAYLKKLLEEILKAKDSNANHSSSIEQLLGESNFVNETNVLDGMQKISLAFSSYVLALNFFQLNTDIAIKRAVYSNDAFEIRQGIRAAVATNNLDIVVLLVNRLINKKAIMSTDFLQLTINYLKLCKFDVDYDSYQANYTDKHYDLYVCNKKIALVGPAEIHYKECVNIVTTQLVARTIGLGSSSFSRSDVFSGKCELAYTDQLYSKNYKDYEEGIDSFSFISLNANTNIPEKTNKWRIARNPNKLIYNGGANKVPIMLFDLLCSNPESIKIYGTTFYSSQVLYSEPYRSYNYTGNRISSNGNTVGDKFGVTTGLASHNPFSNRNFVRNLLGNNKVDLDLNTQDSLKLSDFEYAQRLEINN